MRCPVDETDLVMTERQGIEIDYCPKCRGVWLDRGELDKIVERGTVAERTAAPTRRYDDDDDYDDRRYERREGYDSDRGYGQYPRKKKKRSFLGDLFDMD